jgi:hypothetical protein
MLGLGVVNRLGFFDRIDQFGSLGEVGDAGPSFILARRAGVPVSTLRHREDGRGFPDVPAFFRLAEALAVPAERLAEGVEDPAGDEPPLPT